jgi:phospholipid-binding lipoprotein MlaA
MGSRTAWKSRLAVLLLLGGPAALAGCAMHGRGSDLRTAADEVSASSALDPADSAARPPAGDSPEALEYDPWEPFNERMFAFNRGLDRRVVKPAARGWRKVVPEPLREGIQNAFRNVGMPRRLVNNLLQLKVAGAGRELVGFVVNSTVGLGGFIDIAQREGLRPNDEDTGQTLAVYGVGPGPYLVLPFFPPSTVRDSIGSAADGLLDPLSYLLPFVGSVAKRVTTTVNDRSMNLELSEEVEESVLDYYSAVRNFHLQRRDRDIRE